MMQQLTEHGKNIISVSKMRKCYNSAIYSTYLNCNVINELITDEN